MDKNDLAEQKKLADCVRDILNGVSLNGDAAVIDFTKRFDDYTLSKDNILVTPGEIKYLVGQLKDESLKKAISKAAANIEKFHKNEFKRINKSWFSRGKEVKTGQLLTPVEKVGVYVPGGRFSYFSSILMTVIPARAAGVKKVYLATPPKNITPAVAYACKIAGVDALYRIGGAQAIGAFAFGTSVVEQVDMIIGPGNKYVNEAKRQVFGTVGIDSLAGPSEVAIIADESANIEYIKADLLAQIEHDPDAVSYFITNSQKLYEKVKEFAYANRNEKGEFQIYSEKVNSIADAVESSNKLAPEHLELMVKDPRKILKNIRNAGAVFAGSSTPTALGDYMAGPSHVLPTGGSARFSSGLSVQSFIKRSSYTEVISKRKLKDSLSVQKMAEAEGLNYHKLSIKVRG